MPSHISTTLVNQEIVTTQLSGHIVVTAYGLEGAKGKPRQTNLAGQLLPLRPAGTLTSSSRAQPALPDILPLHWWKDALALTEQLIMEKYGFTTTHFLQGGILLGANLLLSLCLDAFSFSPQLQQRACRCVEFLNFPSENKTKAKEGNLFNSNDLRGSILMFESIAV